MRIKSYEKGFTLIELLIVIVIIGILASVLIAVINPARQQNRARNAAIRSSMQKIGFALNTARAGIGSLPDEINLTEELDNISTVSGCDTVGELDCTVNMGGVALPMTCNGLGYPAVGGSGQCYITIVSANTDLTIGEFRIIAQKFRLNDATDTDEMFVFDSNEGFFTCPSDTSLPDDTGAGLISEVSGCVSE